MGGISSWEAPSESGRQQPLSPALQPGCASVVWGGFLSPARLVSCAPVSRYVSPRQWPLSADNGQREEWRGGQGLRRDNQLSEPAAEWVPQGGSCRAASSKAPFIGPAASEKWTLCGGIQGRSLAWPRLQARFLPALSASRASSSRSPCQQTLFNEKTNSHPQITPRPAVPRTASLAVPSLGLHGPALQKRKGSFIP